MESERYELWSEPEILEEFFSFDGIEQPEAKKRQCEFCLGCNGEQYVEKCDLCGMWVGNLCVMNCPMC